MTKRLEKETSKKKPSGKKEASGKEHSEADPEKGQEFDKLTLPALMDITQVAELKAALLPLVMDSKQDLVVDGGGVERITTPAIQTLLSAIHTVEAQNRRIAFQSPSTTLVNAFSVLGLAEALKRKELV